MDVLRNLLPASFHAQPTGRVAQSAPARCIDSQLNLQLNLRSSVSVNPSSADSVHPNTETSVSRTSSDRQS
ncbi:uncharacterized protein V6R79_003801 [Siganus canaliculatus]